MFVLLDVLALAIIIFCVIRSAKKGFVYIAIECVGFVAAILLSVSLSSPLAEFTYEKAIEEKIVASVSDFEENPSDIFNPVDTVWDNIPDFVKNSSLASGITKEAISEKLNNATEVSLEDTARSASQNLVKPVAVKLFGMLYSTVLFIILLIIVKILAKFVNTLFSFSIIGKANKALGAIVGIPKGILIAAAFCFIITMLVSFEGGKFLLFTEKSINDSYVFNLLTKLSPYNR